MKRSIAAAALLLLVSACRTLPPTPPDTALEPDDPEVVARLSAWTASAQSRDALRGRARLAVDSADGRTQVRSKQVLVAQRPAQLRVEVLGFLNQSVAVIVTDGARFEVFRATDRSYQSGDVGPALLWDEARIALTPAEAIEVLLGAPVGESDWSPQSALRTGDGSVRVDLADASGSVRQRVEFGRDGRLSAAERFDAAGRSVWSARFDDYRDVDGSPLAHAIDIETAIGGTRAEIRLNQVELNPELADDIFRLDRPDVPAPAQSGDGEGG